MVAVERIKEAHGSHLVHVSEAGPLVPTTCRVQRHGGGATHHIGFFNHQPVINPFLQTVHPFHHDSGQSFTGAEQEKKKHICGRPSHRSLEPTCSTPVSRFGCGSAIGPGNSGLFQLGQFHLQAEHDVHNQNLGRKSRALGIQLRMSKNSRSRIEYSHFFSGVR